MGVAALHTGIQLESLALFCHRFLAKPGKQSATETSRTIFLKGDHEAAYSAFEGRTVDGDLLAEWLRSRDVDQVDVCGIATDYCVRATALDANREGFSTRVIERLCAGVAPESTKRALEELRAAGVSIS